MDSAEAMDLAAQIVRRASDRVKVVGDRNLIGHALSVAGPIVHQQLPAVAVLAPLVRDVLLPRLDGMLSPDEYTQIAGALAVIEASMTDLECAAFAVRDAIEAIPDADVSAYLAADGVLVAADRTPEAPDANLPTSAGITA